MVKWVCVYKKGPKFSPDYVIKQANAVKRHGHGHFEFLCITDHEGLLAERSDCISLERKKPGWWSLPEKFRIGGPVVFTGLDTVIMGDLTPFAEHAVGCPEKVVYMIHPFRFPNTYHRLYANGVMIWNGNLNWLYNSYDYNVAKNSYPLEQDYTSARLIEGGYDIRVIQHHITGVLSYKRQILLKLMNPKEARIILFHGEPGVKALYNKGINWIWENWK